MLTRQFTQRRPHVATVPSYRRFFKGDFTVMRRIGPVTVSCRTHYDNSTFFDPRLLAEKEKRLAKRADFAAERTVLFAGMVGQFEEVLNQSLLGGCGIEQVARRVRQNGFRLVVVEVFKRLRDDPKGCAVFRRCAANFVRDRSGIGISELERVIGYSSGSNLRNLEYGALLSSQSLS